MTTASMRRTSYHHGDLSRTLTAFALRRVRSGGADEFSLREAARAAGVTAGAVYKHFADKDTLLKAVAAEGFRLLARRMARHTAGTKGTSRLLATGRAYIAFASAEPRLFRLMFSRAGIPRIQHDQTAPSEAPSSFEQLRAALADVTGTSLERVDKEMMAVAWSVAHGAASLICDGVWAKGDPRADAALKRVARLASESFRKQPGDK